MAWGEEQWSVFVALLRRAWPGELSNEDRNAYRVLLDDVEPDAALAAMKRELHRGRRFRPSVAELLAAIREDPSRPTFEEALALIYGHGGIVQAYPAERTFDDDGHRRRKVAEARRERARQVHPLVGAFAVRQGLDRLAALGLEDPDWGEKRRRDLQVAWEAHCEAFEGREVAAIAAGSGREGLRALDPLAALGLPRPAGELEAGGAGA